MNESGGRSLVGSKVAAAATRMTRATTKEPQSSSCMFSTNPRAKSEEQELNLPLYVCSGCSLSTCNPPAETNKKTKKISGQKKSSIPEEALRVWSGSYGRSPSLG